MNYDEMESRLRDHAQRLKETMAVPSVCKMEELNMKRKNTVLNAKKLMSIAAVAAVFLLGSTAFAAGIGGGWFSHYIEKYDTLPDEQQIGEELGYAPIMPESFENGYVYSSGYAVDNEINDEYGNELDKFKSAFFEYSKDGDAVYFSQNRMSAGVEMNGSVIENYRGTDIYGYGYTNKIVPEDYEMTAEDRAAQESGELIFSWGSDEVSISQVRSVQWMQGDIRYVLMQIDGRLSVKELCDMAKEAMNHS